MTEQDYAAKVRALRAVAEDALDCMTDAWPDRPVTRALRDALLDAPAPSEPGLDDLLRDAQTERDMAEAYYKALETHLRVHGCDHDFSEVAENPYVDDAILARLRKEQNR